MAGITSQAAEKSAIDSAMHITWWCGVIRAIVLENSLNLLHGLWGWRPSTAPCAPPDDWGASPVAAVHNCGMDCNRHTHPHLADMLGRHVLRPADFRRVGRRRRKPRVPRLLQPLLAEAAVPGQRRLVREGKREASACKAETVCLSWWSVRAKTACLSREASVLLVASLTCRAAPSCSALPRASTPARCSGRAARPVMF